MTTLTRCSRSAAALKPFAVVRTLETHRQHAFVWGTVYLACVWIVALFWWARGIHGDYVLLSAAHLLTALGFAALLGRQDPLRDTELFIRYAQLTACGLILFAVVSALDFRKAARVGLTYLPLVAALVLSVAVDHLRPRARGQQRESEPRAGAAGRVHSVAAGAVPGRILRAPMGTASRRSQSDRSRVSSSGVAQPAARGLRRFRSSRAWRRRCCSSSCRRDLGPALFLSCVFLITYAIARNRVGLAVIGFATLVAGFYVGYALNISSTLAARVAMWQSTWDNGVRGGEQIAQAIWGLSTGGLFGTGLGLGDTGYVPAGFTDLMLAAIGEELGFVGLVAVAVLFVMIAARGFNAALQAADDYGFFLATVLTLFLTLPVLVMGAGMLGVDPAHRGGDSVSEFRWLSDAGQLHRVGHAHGHCACASTATPHVTDPFRAGVKRLIAGLGVAAVALVAVLFNVQVLRADTLCGATAPRYSGRWLPPIPVQPADHRCARQDPARDGLRSTGLAACDQ